jgi:hypothetical protein
MYKPEYIRFQLNTQIYKYTEYTYWLYKVPLKVEPCTRGYQGLIQNCIVCKSYLNKATTKNYPNSL